MNCPLVVDLDGTLIHTDLLHESALRVVHQTPIALLSIPCWLMQGKAALRRRLHRRASIDPDVLPYNHDLIDWLKRQRETGRRLVMCTANDHTIAHKIADHLGIFDEVMASDGTVTLRGETRADALEQRFGRDGFDYAGGSQSDLPVWRRARRAILVGASASIARSVTAGCHVEHAIPSPGRSPGTWSRVLRTHQWLKNLLLLVPLIATHRFTDQGAWISLFLAFASFCLCASTVYIFNDLMDLESDRRHPRKSRRPFASGLVPARSGVVLLLVLLTCSLGLALPVGTNFLTCLLLYFGLTTAYSLGLKRLVLIDCLVLAMLFNLRIIAGAAAADIALSFWLLAFTVFLFLSLAFLKRYAEIEANHQSIAQTLPGRGYRTSDASLLQTFGVTSGYTSGLVLVFYVDSQAVVQLYRTPEVLWGLLPILLFWISWMWMQTHRGNMHDDPVVFAVTDKGSLLAGAAFAAVLTIGTLGWSWL